MKIAHLFPIVSLIIIGLTMTGCKDGKKESLDGRDNQEMQMENDEMELETKGERQPIPEDAAGVGPAAKTGGSTGASNNLKMGTEKPDTGNAVNLDEMYNALKMTDEQIGKFESAMGNDQLNSLKNTGGELPGNLYENMESQLESILDKEQFEKYREWEKGQ